MIGRFLYRIFFKASLDRLELILFIDRNERHGRCYDEYNARKEIEAGR